MNFKLTTLIGLALALGCSDRVAGTVVLPTDGSAWSDGGTMGDGKGGDASTPPKDAAGGEEDAVLADGGGTTGPGKLVFAMPDGNKDDFGGQCETLCALKVNQNAPRDLWVRYTREGKPADAAVVLFQLKDPQTANGEVLTGNTFTDQDGKAVGSIKGHQDLGVFEVTASVPDDPGAGHLVFQIHVVSKAKGPLQIFLHYKGLKDIYSFGAIKVRLTRQEKPGEPPCKALDLGDTLPQAEWESPPNLQWDKPWTVSYPAFASWVQQQGGEVAFTVIGVAAKSQLAMPVAAGCVDTYATVKWNATTQSLEGDDVHVDVFDIPPRLKGTYDLTMNLDLLSILPDNVENVLKIVLDIITDPVAGILSLACKLGGSNLDSFCGYIFEDPKSPSIKQLKQPFGEIIVKFIDAILLSLLPVNVQKGLAAGADLGEILTNLEIRGILRFDAEPDNSGYVSAKDTWHEWNKIIYKWSLGQSCSPYDPNCGKKGFDISAFQQEAIVGHFEAWRDVIKSELKIGKHGLKVKWGALVNHIIQKQLLPMLTADPKDLSAPVVDSWEKLIKSLLGNKGCLKKDTCCDEFGAKLEAQQGLLKKDFLAATCETLVKLGTAYFNSQIDALDAQTGDPSKNSGLLLGTEHCPLFVIKNYAQLGTIEMVDAIGVKSNPCTWDMTVTVGGKPEPLKSVFFATRQE